MRLFSLGEDCTVNHGLNDFAGYDPLYPDGLRKSPFGGTWIYDLSNRRGHRRTNYGSLSVVADVINKEFAGWSELKKNYRGLYRSARYPIEFTHYRGTDETWKHLNIPSVQRFMGVLRSGNEPVIFTSSWRVYSGFKMARLPEDLKRFTMGNAALTYVLLRKYPDLKYELKFFFVVDRGRDEHVKYVHTLMAGRTVPYALIYNEVDSTPGRRWRQRFDCAGWPDAIKKTSIPEGVK